MSVPDALLPVVTNFCPGCTHGIVHRLVAEAIDELGIEGKTVGVTPVGCSVLGYNFFGCDMVEAAHGRAPAVATGIKRVLPITSSSPIRAMAICFHRHGRDRTRPRVARTSPSFSSTTQSTA